MSTTTPTNEWWEHRRFRYNVGLLVAGLLSFVAYCLVVDKLLPRVPYIDPTTIEVTIFTMVFQGFAYVIMMGVANVCYFLGPLSERIIRPRRLEKYRERCFSLGYWFSFALPFAVPVSLAILALYFPEYWKPN